MKHFHGKTYLTLKEATDAYGGPGVSFIPASLSFSVVGVSGLSVDVDTLFLQRYKDRYIAWPIENATDAATVSVYMGAEAANVVVTFRPYIENLQRMVAQLVDDGEEESLEYKRAPNGATSFASAFSDGGTLRKKSGAASGNVDRILRYQNEIVNAVNVLLDRLDDMFIGVLTNDWGVEEVEV